MADGAIRWWQTLTTVAAEAVELSDPVVVLPVAAIEQHGPHLPLSTDLELGLGLLERPGDFVGCLHLIYFHVDHADAEGDAFIHLTEGLEVVAGAVSQLEYHVVGSQGVEEC